MAKDSRIYAVCHKRTGNVRLVRANHPAQAVRHAAQTDYDARVAEQDDIVDAMSAGAKVETAGEDSPPGPDRDPRVGDLFPEGQDSAGGDQQQPAP